MTAEEVWDRYLYGEQTVAEISTQSGVSPSTIKRLLATTASKVPKRHTRKRNDWYNDWYSMIDRLIG